MKYFWIAIIGSILFSCSSDRTNRIRTAPLLTRSFVDHLGNQISLKGKVERIVSLSPAITETLYAIGAGDQVIGRSEACDFPEDVIFLPGLSLKTDLTSGGLLELAPQLLLIPDGILHPDQFKYLKNHNLPFLVIRTESLSDVYESIRFLGDVTDNRAVAAYLADSLQARENRIVAHTRDLIKYGTAVLVDNDPLVVAGGQGLFQELISKAGGQNRFQETSTTLYETNEAEFHAMKPEYLFIPSKESQVYQMLIGQYPSIYDTPAAALNQVFVLDPDLIYRPGPRIIEGLRLMAQSLHSDLTDL